MRAKIDAELQELKEEFDAGGITWSERDVKRLIAPYPKHEKVDQVLENLGEDFCHDSVHRLHNDVPAVAAGTDKAELSAVATVDADAQAGESDSTSNDADSNDEREDFSTIAVAGDDLPAVAAMEAKAHCEDLALARTDADAQVERVWTRFTRCRGTSRVCEPSGAYAACNAWNTNCKKKEGN